MQPSLTTTVSNFLRGPFVSFEDRTWPGHREIRESNDLTAGISRRLSNVFLPRLVGIGPDKLAVAAKSETELSACLYMFHVGRLLRRSESLSSLFAGPGKLSRQLAHKISLLRVMKRRAVTSENTTAGRLTGIIHSGRGEWTSTGCFDTKRRKAHRGVKLYIRNYSRNYSLL